MYLILKMCRIVIIFSLLQSKFVLVIVKDAHNVVFSYLIPVCISNGVIYFSPPSYTAALHLLCCGVQMDSLQRALVQNARGPYPWTICQLHTIQMFFTA